MDENKFVVTVTNQFCSGGRIIARRLGELLGVECYNDYIAEEAARRLNLTADEVDITEERSRPMIRSSLFQNLIQRMDGTADKTQTEIFYTQQDIIKALGAEGNCIVVGRCSDFILEELPCVLHVYIYAPYEYRVRHCMESLEIEEEAARVRVAEADEARKAYHLNFTGFAADDPRHKGVMMDSSLLGVDGTARILEQIVREKFGLK